jgi:hypothetical protein
MKRALLLVDANQPHSAFVGWGRGVYDRDPRIDRLSDCADAIPVREQDQFFEPCASAINHGTVVRPLEFISVFSGHPDALGQLKPRMDNPSRVTWKLESQPGFYWVTCSFEGGETLMRPLPLGSLECVSDKNTHHCERVRGKR